MSGISKLTLLVFLPLIMFHFQVPTNIASAPAPADKQEETEDDDEEDPSGEFNDLAIKIHNTIVEIETGGTGDCSLRGQSGEIGCHQFLPATWRAYSYDVFGYVPEQTKVNARHVALTKIEDWLNIGKSARDIFLIWNQGHSGECVSGINKHGVPYDSCAYADHALNILDKKLSTYQSK